jgi:hypothetical protein
MKDAQAPLYAGSRTHCGAPNHAGTAVHCAEGVRTHPQQSSFANRLTPPARQPALMPRIRYKCEELTYVADAQAGLITAAQLAELGVHSSTASRWAAGHMLTRVVRGVHLYGGGYPNRLQREVAALLYAGPGSVLTGTTALRHHGIRAARLQELADDQPLHPEPVHVLIPHSRHRTSTGYVCVERTHRLPTAASFRNGVAIVDLPRAAGDAARRMPHRGDVLAVLSEVVQRELATVVALEDELKAGNRRGSMHFRAALEHLAGGTRSAPEADLRTLTVAAGLTELLWNVTLVSSNGGYVASPDAWDDEIGLALEVDSQEHHGFGDGLRRTVERNARYARHGVLVYPVMPWLLRDDKPRVIRELREAHDCAANRPRPDVRVQAAKSVSAGRVGWRWGA